MTDFAPKGATLTPSKIEVMRLLTLRSMLKLEMMGMHRSRSPSAYAIIKKELGFRGTRAKVLAEMDKLRTELLGVENV